MIDLLNKIFNRNKNGLILGKATCSSLGPSIDLGNPILYHPTEDELNGTYVTDWPGYIGLEVTNVCNLECTHCNYRFGVPHYTRARGFVEDEVVEKVLSEASNYKTQVMMNYDGEPMMNRDYLKHLKYAEDKGVKTYFNTNGMLFLKNLLMKLFHFIKEY